MGRFQIAPAVSFLDDKKQGQKACDSQRVEMEARTLEFELLFIGGKGYCGGKSGKK